MLQDLTDCPRLFTDTNDRCAGAPGSAGTSWFISILTALAENPDILNKVSSMSDIIWGGGGGRVLDRIFLRL